MIQKKFIHVILKSFLALVFFVCCSVAVNAAEQATSVSLGGEHSAAITQDGSLYMWGYNIHGQLGLGDNNYRSTPQKVKGIENVKSVVLGGLHSAAITQDGSLYTWGYNNCGQLGLGNKTNYNIPEMVTKLHDVQSVSLGWVHSAAITQKGSLFMWGSNYYGELGIGKNNDERSTPEEVTKLHDVQSVALGEFHSAAITKGGHLHMWGANNCGQLGLGDTTNRSKPVEVNSSDKSTDDKKLNVDSLSYRFANSKEGFGYKDSYHIPLSTYKIIFKPARARQIYNDHKNGWGGNCFGMSTTSGLFNSPDGSISASDFNVNAKRIKDLKLSDSHRQWKMKLTTFIEAMHISQYTDRIQDVMPSMANQYGKIVKLVKDAEKGSGLPIILLKKKDGSGHAVLGYKITEPSSTETRIYIYDCNEPLKDNNYIELTKTATGYYTGWKCGSVENDKDIRAIPYLDYKAVWSNRGKLDASSSSTNYLSVGSSDFEVVNNKGKKVASVKNGALSTNNISIREIMTVDMGKCKNQRLLVPPGQFQIINKGKNKTFTVNAVHNENQIEVKTTAKKVAFNVNDKTGSSIARVEGGKSTKFVISAGADKNGNTKVTYSGKVNKKTKEMGVVKGKLFFGGTDSNVSIKVNGKQYSGWIKDKNGTKYRKKNGTYLKNMDKRIKRKHFNFDNKGYARPIKKGGAYKTKGIKVKKAKKSLRVKWKKVKRATKYQLCYSTNKKFKKNVKWITVNAYKKKGSVIKKLKKKQNYYIKVRAICKTFCGGWSKVISSRTK